MAFERRVALARLGCRHFSLVRMHDNSAGANDLQLFRSVMIVTGHQRLQCITGLGKQPSCGTAMTNDCTSKDDCGQSWARKWWALQIKRSCRQPTGLPHTPARSPGQEAEGA